MSAPTRPPGATGPTNPTSPTGATSLASSAGATRQAGAAETGHVAVEPVLAAHEIQGDVLAGFRKDNAVYLFLRITDTSGARRALTALLGRVSPLADVARFNRLFRSVRRRRGEVRGSLSATWLNIAFTATGLAALVGEEAVRQFDDDAFRLGLAARSALLGDPTDPASAGHPGNWRVGGPTNPVDAVVIVAGDSPADLTATAAWVSDIATRPHDGTPSGFAVVFEQRCAARPDLPGHEHFGFRDGVSQPGPRGRLGDGPDDYLVPRVIAPGDPRSRFFGRPGERLVWPGEFVLGLPRQPLPPRDEFDPLPGAVAGPAWARDGSYLVIRRLRQDVAAFTSFLDETAARLRRDGTFPDLTADRLAALLVGRWPSGAPLVRTPLTDDPALGADDFAVNDFSYLTAEPACPLRPGVHPPDRFPATIADPQGRLCAHAAHIRKVNPRDQATDLGGARTTLHRRLLRRGLPFGPPLTTTVDDEVDRGLLFASYQASIEDQFEFVSQNWVNRTNRPSADPGGHDLILGQAAAAPGRRRVTYLLDAAGDPVEITTATEWVTPTGGGYFFAPSISALRALAQPPA